MKSFQIYKKRSSVDKQINFFGSIKKNLSLTFFICLFISGFSQGQTNNNQKEQQRSIEELIELADYHEKNDNTEEATKFLNQIALHYWKNRRFQNAINHYLKTVELNQEKGNLENVKTAYSNIGLIYTEIENLRKALEYFNKSLKVRLKTGNQKSIAAGHIDLAYILGGLGNHEEAIKHAQKALDISLDQNYPKLTLNCYNLLAKNYQKFGNIKKATDFENKYYSYQQHLEEQSLRQTFQEKEEENLAEIRRTQAEKRAKELELELRQAQHKRRQDSLNMAMEVKQNSLQQAKRADSLKQQQIELLNKQQQLQEAKLEQQQAVEQQQQTIIQAGTVVLVLIIAMAIILIRNNKQKQKVNQELSVKNQEIENKSNQLEKAFDQIQDQNTKITSSITYAQNIQKALLPQQKELVKYLPESFILFKPRDVVSGDFYWFQEIDPRFDLYETQKEIKARKNDFLPDNPTLPIANNKFAISAADCTGHGVPGAFISMLGYHLLDHIIESGVTKPELILKQLHTEIRKTLRQEKTNNQEGMDISLCVINKAENSVHFAGARNHLYYLSNGKVELAKADRISIGGTIEKEAEGGKKYFKGTTIEVDKPTWFYMLSDGYSDQFGGENNEKFTKGRLKKLLYEIHQKPPNEQKNILDHHFEEWKKGFGKQLDDVTVIGFKLSPDSQKTEA